MLAVPVLATLTDRIDARRVLLGRLALSGLGTAAFGLFADGLWSASAIWALAGIGFAGAYMPGLKALTDRLPPKESRAASRSTPAASRSASGCRSSSRRSSRRATAGAWRSSSRRSGPLVMIAASLAMPPFRPAPAQGHLLDFRPVLRNRAAMGYVLGYGAHCFELYGMRTWIVAFWTYVAARNGDALLSPIAVSVIAALLSLPPAFWATKPRSASAAIAPSPS
jgi:hypothetical protein